MTAHKPAHADPRVPARETCVVRYLIDHWAEERATQVFAIFDGGRQWTFRELRDRTIAVAAGLARAGVKRGDHVLAWQPNTPEMLLTFFAINYLGAVYVPINTAYRGRVLEHVVENSDARVAVVHADLVPRLASLNLARLEKLVVVGGDVAESQLPVTPFGTLSGTAADLPELSRPIEPWDTQSIIYTSGTTGPSKGVLSSYLHMYTNPGPEAWWFVTAEDRFLVNMPMFHIGGLGLSFAMLVRGGSIVMPERFSTDEFWPVVRDTRTTTVFLLGVMATFLLKIPPGPADRDHFVRKVFIVPLSDGATEFHERFGVDVYTIFNMTEISSPIVSIPNPAVRGTCGKVRPGVDVRLVDENDCEVGVGVTGEMIIRTDRPWAMNHGYYKNPEATARAWRNGWFHTGDAFRKDADGNFFFVDRIKDAIRRRGENISSFEVEAEIIAFPAVREAAAIAVPSEVGEDEVLAVVAPTAGQAIDPAALIEFLRDRMAYFMIPRYIRVLPELPKTPSSKVMKAELRAQGITPDTWDREQAGIRISRDRIGS
ncbi:MAG: ATP-dependent acyl-CoA ligase [Betaproteobacteria bacterium]|nr:ATP-dependent acyl-CoA ligase [Betaproteobacteria bacterium]